ncbi:MAG: DNA polymerase III subunit tau [Pelotomaculum sp. PtaU1.Bin035]|nr:MAG: DNA polymerase III subunit tau [Pelotomaculum sp. PtaU1.Bin035]
MAYLALYREWRPQTFGAIVGQAHITRTLQNAVEAGRAGHAYLFCGTRGTGKTTTAKVLAKALNCAGRNGPEPCNLCASCKAITEGLSVDVIEVDAASNRGIDEIRDLREKVKFAPATGQFRVYIIDEVHMLTNEAFNALLKTLEEPPRHSVFILATTEPHKVPLTILSRCQRFDFRRIAPGEIVGRLKEVAAGAGIEVEEDALRLIARAAEGGLRDALSILDQGAALGEMRVTAGIVHDILGTVRADALSRMGGHLAAGEAGPALRLVGELTGMGKDLRIFARELAAYLRAVLLEKISPGDPAGEAWGDTSVIARTAVEFSEQGLIRAIDIMAGAEREMKWSSLPGVILEIALVKACRREVTSDLSSLAERVADIEEKLKNFIPKRAVETPVDETAPLKWEKLPGRRAAAQDIPGETSPLQERGTATETAAAGAKLRREPGQSGGFQRPDPVAAGEIAEVAREFDLDKIKASWGNIMGMLRKERPPLYPNFIKAVPLHVGGRRLTVGFPEGEELVKEMAERSDNKKYFEDLLGKALGEGWQVVYKYYHGEVRIPVIQPAPKDDISRRFGGGEITLEDGSEGSLF